MSQLPRVIAATGSALLLLSSCGTQNAPTVPQPQAQAAAPRMVQGSGPVAATPAPASPTTPAPPTVRLTTTPQTLKQAGSVFFFVGGADKSGKGLARTEVFVDGRPFVNDPHSHNSYAKAFTAADNGKHVVKVVLTDNLGVSSTVEQEFMVAIGQ